MNNSQKNFDIGSKAGPMVSECRDFAKGIALGDYHKATLNATILALQIVPFGCAAASHSKVAMGSASKGTIITQAAAVSAAN